MMADGGEHPKQQPATRGTQVRVPPQHPLFRALPPPAIERLASYMQPRRVARSCIIFAKGDADTGLMGVLAGSIMIGVGTAKWPQRSSAKSLCSTGIHASPTLRRCSTVSSLSWSTDFMPFLRQRAPIGAAVHRDLMCSAASDQRAGPGHDIPGLADEARQDVASADSRD